MKCLFLFITTLVILTGCSRTNTDLFDDSPSIYFDGDLEIDFTFAKHKIDEVVIRIPVEIGGYKNSVERTFNLQIVEDSTTAIKGVHYEIMMPKIMMPADSFKVHIPIKVFNSDPSLKSEKVRLYLKLQPNENFVSGIYNKQELSLYISDILLKPSIWDNVYSGFFGVYSEAKHRKILEICDIAEIPDVYDGGSYNYKWDAFGRAVNNYYKAFYPQYDENNQVIEPWM